MRACVHCGAEFAAATKGNGKHRRYCSENCRKRRWSKDARRPCPDCGVEIAFGVARCWDCTQAVVTAAREERYALIQKLWLEGLPIKEIAPKVGLANANCLGVQMNYMKHAGWELPPRRPGWKGHTNPNPPPTRFPLTKSAVNARLGYALRMGRIVRPDACERCGREGHVDGHHHDYSKPLEVEWLCRPCHLAEHGKTPAGLHELQAAA